MAFALPFFNTEILAIVMPTFSARSVTLIFRLASMTSMLMMIAMCWGGLHGQVILGFHIHGILENPFERRRGGGNDDGSEGDEDAHEDAAGAVVRGVQHDEHFTSRHKADDGDGAELYSPKCFHGRLREDLILSSVPQHLECLIQRREKRNGSDIRVRQEGIFEIDLKGRGV